MLLDKTGTNTLLTTRESLAISGIKLWTEVVIKISTYITKNSGCLVLITQ